MGSNMSFGSTCGAPVALPLIYQVTYRRSEYRLLSTRCYDILRCRMSSPRVLGGESTTCELWLRSICVHGFCERIQ